MAADISLNEFLSELGAGTPTPGGGGACGYVAAVGMSLGKMVANLTTGKKKYAQYQEEVEQLIDETTRMTAELVQCMENDEESFKPLAAAYGLPKDTPQEAAHKEEVMEKALVVASEAPLSMMEKILCAMKLLERLAVIGSRIAISDVGVGIKMCEAAMSGASLNVYINTGLMKDRSTADAMNTRADELIRESAAIADKTFSLVMSEIRK